MWRIIPLAIFQSLLLTGGQVFLKLALMRMAPFGWNRAFWSSVFVNWQFAVCGLLFLTASLLWMYIVKVFPFSMAYPLVSLSYVFGMLAAILIFHEEVPLTRWVGVLLIMAGCMLMPADAKAKLASWGAVLIPAHDLAVEAGNAKCENVAILGALEARVGFGVDIWKKVIEGRVPPKTVDANLKAFDLGFEFAHGR